MPPINTSINNTDASENEWIANTVHSNYVSNANNHLSDTVKRSRIDKNDYDDSSELEKENEEKILLIYSEKENNEKKVSIRSDQHSQKVAEKIILDENEYPLDLDGDGVPDYLNKYPTVPKPASNKSCPEIPEESKKGIQKTTGDIVFKSAQAVIAPTSYKSLNEVVRILNANSNYMLIISGHTDNVGNTEANLILSEKRADAVKYYLIQKGICRKRISTQGYGDTKPTDISDIPEGRSRNRRVDLTIAFMKEY